VNHFDLLILRATDIRQLSQEGVLNVSPNAKPTDILSDARNLPRIIGWLDQRLREHGRQIFIPALATYFPDITSHNRTEWSRAVEALANTVQIAIELRKNGWMKYPIVEIVCGTILDRCNCDDCARQRQLAKPKDIVLMSTFDAKLRRLRQGLKEMVCKLPRQYRKQDFYVALELEPGLPYVLNGEWALARVMRMIEAPKSGLASFVGLNVDIAHMRMAKVTAAMLEPHMDKIMHAHIADHPCMHTRDQIVGSWTHLERDDEFGFASYLRLLSKRAKSVQTKGSGLPFSGAVALELEGCGRMSWIHESLCAMRRLFYLYG
jgi:hypothetical protein